MNNTNNADAAPVLSLVQLVGCWALVDDTGADLLYASYEACCERAAEMGATLRIGA